jgi:hypothetical protein
MSGILRQVLFIKKSVCVGSLKWKEGIKRKGQVFEQNVVNLQSGK